MTQMTFDAVEGQRLKRKGLERVEAKNARFIEKMRAYAREWSHHFSYVTTDDLRKYSEGAGLYPTHHNAWGAIFKQKGWMVIGRQPSKLAGNHGRYINVYRWEGV
jgi:hypothetical protein